MNEYKIIPNTKYENNNKQKIILNQKYKNDTEYLIQKQY